ncbi:hypothetical protein D3C84_1012260 [compost metagenome]
MAFCIESRHCLTALLALSRLAALCARFWFSSSRPAGSRSTTSASGTRDVAVTARCTSTRSPLLSARISRVRPFKPRYSRRMFMPELLGAGA